MKKQPRFLVAVTAMFLLVVNLVIVSSCKKDKDSSTPASNVKVNASPTLGSYLTDSAGMALYVFTPDVKGPSVCYGQCEVAWPVFYTTQVRVSGDLKVTDFGTITRTDGSKQTTYKGWPLYYYVQDQAAGETKGENVGHVWFVAKDYSLMLADQNNEQYLSSIDGRTLYIFTPDGNNTSNCSGQCLAAWPEFFVENLTVPSSIAVSDFQTITRTDGKKQITYQGKPLYYFANDTQRGDLKGVGVNNVWFLANP